MINPAKILRIRSAWEQFTKEHTKFPYFLDAVNKSGVKQGTVIEISVTNPDGKTIKTNIKLSESDVEFIKEATSNMVD